MEPQEIAGHPVRVRCVVTARSGGSSTDYAPLAGDILDTLSGAEAAAAAAAAAAPAVPGLPGGAGAAATDATGLGDAAGAAAAAAAAAAALDAAALDARPWAPDLTLHADGVFAAYAAVRGLALAQQRLEPNPPGCSLCLMLAPRGAGSTAGVGRGSWSDLDSSMLLALHVWRVPAMAGALRRAPATAAMTAGGSLDNSSCSRVQRSDGTASSSSSSGSSRSNVGSDALGGGGSSGSGGQYLLKVSSTSRVSAVAARLQSRLEGPGGYARLESRGAGNAARSLMALLRAQHFVRLRGAGWGVAVVPEFGACPPTGGAVRRGGRETAGSVVVLHVLRCDHGPGGRPVLHVPPPDPLEQAAAVAASSVGADDERRGASHTWEPEQEPIERRGWMAAEADAGVDARAASRLRRYIIAAGNCAVQQAADEIVTELLARGQCLVLADGDADVSTALQVMLNATKRLAASDGSSQLLFKVRCYPDVDDSEHFDEFPTYFALAFHVVRANAAAVAAHLARLPDTPRAAKGGRTGTAAATGAQTADGAGAAAAQEAYGRRHTPPEAPEHMRMQSYIRVAAPRRTAAPNGVDGDVGGDGAAARLAAYVMRSLAAHGVARLGSVSAGARVASLRAAALVTDALALARSLEAVASVRADVVRHPDGAELPVTTVTLMLAAGLDAAYARVQHKLLGGADRVGIVAAHDADAAAAAPQAAGSELREESAAAAAGAPAASLAAAAGAPLRLIDPRELPSEA